VNPRARVLIALLATAACASCVEVRYQTRTPRIGDPAQPPITMDGIVVRDSHFIPGIDDRPHDEWARPKVTKDGLQDEEVSDKDERTVRMEVRIAPGARAEIADMTWSPAEAPRCAGGHPALDILVGDVDHNSWAAPDVQIHWERPVVVSDGQILAGRFDEDPPLLHRASVVDVLVVHRHGGGSDAGQATQECVRIPATGPDTTFWNKKRWSAGARLVWRRSFAFSPSSTLGFGLSVGRWIGPVRLGIEGTFGGTNDTKPDADAPSGTGFCFLAPGFDCDNLTFGGGSLEASGVGWRWDRWALGWSVAFESIYGSLYHTPAGSTAATHRTAVSLGPRLGLQVLRAVPAVGGVSRASPTSAWGFELFAAAGNTVSGAADGPPIAFGVGVIGF